MKRLLLALPFLLLPASARAQAITSYTPTITNTTTSIQTTSAPLPISSWVCGQPRITSTITVNALRIAVDDPNSPLDINGVPTLDCVWTDPGTGPLVALPFGPAGYTMTLVATNSAGASAPSVASAPFSHPGVPPAAPINPRVVR